MTCGKAAADVVQVAEHPTAASLATDEAGTTINAALSDFATGATEQNVVYLGNRLMYRNDAEEIDPVRSPMVFVQILLQMFLFVAGPAVLTVTLAVAAGILAVIDAVAHNPLTSSLGSLARILLVL